MIRIRVGHGSHVHSIEIGNFAFNIFRMTCLILREGEESLADTIGCRRPYLLPEIFRNVISSRQPLLMPIGAMQAATRMLAPVSRNT